MENEELKTLLESIIEEMRDDEKLVKKRNTKDFAAGFTEAIRILKVIIYQESAIRIKS